MTTQKTILITGASRGIGFLTAQKLVQEGHIVYAGMRDLDSRNAEAAKALKLFAEGLPGKLVSVDLDVADEKGVERTVAAIEAEQPIDVLVNNAGVMPVGLTEGFTMEQAKDLFDVNVYGIMHLTRAVLPAMRARKSGLVISLSSVAGRFGMPFFGLYCASKWAMEAYCESLHYELEPFGVESVLVEPSGHGTDLVTSAPAPGDAVRVGQYGDYSKGRDRLLGMFQGMFDQGEAITDAGNVATKILELIAMDGSRPIRTQVGQDMGVTAINEATAPIQAQLVSGLKPVYMGAAS
ncbi:SDR family oxidoreductase [Roseibium aggregatum]|uniref:SDR family oxidoreductase n=1 Tax=Roseibium aggregatum TaxID=187304 RepID=UPI0025ACFCFB|nr:SDR family oxidoreductase [Roseibium aggregatum]WJS04404.1 SDR family oxidoreductase [Roseibium aggregatum]